MKETITVDRIESNYAVCIYKNQFSCYAFNIALADIEGKVREGIKLEKKGYGYTVIEPTAEELAAAENAKKRLDALFKRK